MKPFAFLVLFAAGCAAAGSAPEPEIVVDFEAPAPAILPPFAPGPPEMLIIGWDLSVEPPQPIAAPEAAEPPPAPTYHGGEAVEGHGLGWGAVRLLPDGGDHTFGFRREPAPHVREALERAVERMNAELPSWNIVEVEELTAQTDVKIDLTEGEPSAGCSDLEAGTCWFGSAGCRARAKIDTGLEELAVCEWWNLHGSTAAIASFAESRGLDEGPIWEAFFFHEIGHTLGLNHAHKRRPSIMSASLTWPGFGQDVQQGFSACELERLEGYLPMPGAAEPLTVIPSEICQ